MYGGANLVETQLNGANLVGAQLKGASLRGGNLESVNLSEAKLDGAYLKDVVLGDKQRIGPQLADVQWGNTNLAVVDWSQLRMLGDEYKAQQRRKDNGEVKDSVIQLEEHKRAVRANRQLAVVLQNQGLNEESEPFAYRSQLLQRKVFWRQHLYGRWLFSMFLALLSGYGYRIRRILATYVLVVLLFSLAYFAFGIYYPPHLPLLQAFLESITAFHGRVFLEQFILNTPQIWFTALEAILGLIIEGVFIAMLIQRFIGK